MNIKNRFAVFIGKISKKLLRLLRRGGTTLPGRLALKISPGLLEQLASGVRCIVVTGTNGKTTSVRIIEEMFIQSDIPFFANRSGANLISGVTTVFIDNCSLFGKMKKPWALIECDEAASIEVCRLIDPEIVLVTNVFRDQLDRFGEVSHTLENILSGIKNSPNAAVCLNADCSLTVSIANQIPNGIMFYGVDVPIYKNPVDEISDASHCIYCKHEYEYSYRTFGHLGGFSCPECGYSRPERQLAVTEIISTTLCSTTVALDFSGEKEQAEINLPGGYNIYNAVAAFAVSELVGFKRDDSIRAVGSFSCGFGRMEQFDLGKAKARMILIKNPAGCNQVLNYLASFTEKAVFVFCLNDRTADGTDISWIWDVNFESLVRMGEILGHVYVSGIRAYDMALRLKYAGIEEDKLSMVEDYDRLIDTMCNQELPVVIVPTYTAMMDLREKMSSVFGAKNFWE